MVDLEAVLSRQESVLTEFLVYCQFEHNMEQVRTCVQYRTIQRILQHVYIIGQMTYSNSNFTVAKFIDSKTLDY